MRASHLAAALLMVTIWGFNFIVIRWGLNDVPPLTLTVLRFALAAFPAVLFVRRPQPSWRLVTGYGLFAFALQFGLLFAGMHAGMPTGLASLVIQVQAFFTIGLVALLTHERTKPIQLIGATIAGAGLVLVAFHLPPSTRLGFFLVVAAAASWAFANVIVKRIHSEEPLAVVVWASAAAAIAMLPVALVIEGPATMWAAVTAMDALAWLGLAFQAWPTTLLAFGIWAWLLRQHPAALIAPFTLLVPIVAMTLAVLLLGEEVTWWKLAAIALVLSGLGLNVIASRTRRDVAVTPPA
ncbi:MAG TPA: EamA family transporter [Burkholderiaceae bacterium]|nr:EamA family transporter [Burkholderiaceae bacterium]